MGCEGGRGAGFRIRDDALDRGQGGRVDMVREREEGREGGRGERGRGERREKGERERERRGKKERWRSGR